MLLSSSFGMAKKKVEDPEITKLKAKIENVMSQVDKQPDWLYSRLQMFWKTNASDVFVNGEAFAHPGGERATEPTSIPLVQTLLLSTGIPIADSTKWLSIFTPNSPSSITCLAA